MARAGTCWDDGPDYCSGCSYCQAAMRTPADEPVWYPDEQDARDFDLMLQRSAVDAAQEAR